MKIFTMLAVLAVSVNAGYRYTIPDATFHQYGYPQSINLSGNIAQSRHVSDPSPQHEKAISYSISYSDYLYLKRHKTEGQDSPFNPERPPEGNSQHDNRYHNHYGHGDADWFAR